MSNAEYSRSPKIVLIGGGTGSFTLLRELKLFTPNLSAVVNMSDDGGSTGRLRDELGVLPPGDVRQCLVALSDTPALRDIFNYRFGEGSFSGHSLGNIILSGLELQYGSFDRAIKVAADLLHVTGAVIPVTLDRHELIMRDGRGVVRGEHLIGHRVFRDPQPQFYLEPAVKLNPEAAVAIKDADLVVVAPGNLFGSLVPALLVDGMRLAITSTKAKTVVVSNLVTKPGQTDGWHVVDYVRAVEHYIGVGQIDYVLYNDRAPSRQLLSKYAADREFPVAIEPERFGEVGAKAIGANLVAGTLSQQDKRDTAIRRTLIRHDAYEVGRQLMRIFYE